MMKFKKDAIIIAVLMIMISVAVVIIYVLWSAGAFIPKWVSWEENNIFDASGNYEISLTDKTVHVAYNDETIWNSPGGVKVQQILSCDIDRDGQDELILLCWKRGRFGRQKPFWVENDETGWSQHIFVYEYADDEIVPKWMSSYIGEDVAGLSAGGNKNGDMWLLLTDKAGDVSYWRWSSWGFERDAPEVSFAVFGDNMIHEPIYVYGLNHGGNFDFLYEHVKDKIAESDVAVIHQETPFVTEEAKYGDYPRFGTPVQVGEAIAAAGFDVVCCATNHALDRGAEGVHTTKEFFSEQDILCLGIQGAEEMERKPYEIIRRNGAKFALLNLSYGTNGNALPEGRPFMVHLLNDERQIREDIKNAKEEADFVIVFVHWGTENSAEVDDFQKKWTEVFLESKADVVVGSHPHVLQPFEVLKGDDGHRMLCYYSIGNFVSAQPEKVCEKGGVAEFTIAPGENGYEIISYGLQPLQILWREGGAYTAVFAEEAK